MSTIPVNDIERIQLYDTTLVIEFSSCGSLPIARVVRGPYGRDLFVYLSTEGSFPTYHSCRLRVDLSVYSPLRGSIYVITREGHRLTVPWRQQYIGQLRYTDPTNNLHTSTSTGSSFEVGIQSPRVTDSDYFY